MYNFGLYIDWEYNYILLDYILLDYILLDYILDYMYSFQYFLHVKVHNVVDNYSCSLDANWDLQKILGCKCQGIGCIVVSHSIRIQELVVHTRWNKKMDDPKMEEAY
jgi:hypothetical protein